MVTTSSADLRHGIASEQALPQSRALRTPETAQGHATSRRLKTPTVNGNFTTLLARSILMARWDTAEKAAKAARKAAEAGVMSCTKSPTTFEEIPDSKAPRGLLTALLIHRTIGLINIEDLRPARRRELRSDAYREREFHNIIGKEYIDGEIHYLVDWVPNLVRGSILRKARARGGRRSAGGEGA
ncbi:unnamed protein product [Sphagnum compactum]